ncbi:Cytochrome bd ubiquinol oxidase subunit 1 [Candidatus Bealeia paramacronuclearis]|uniref:Cytochrome bd ubiquinol oxidase subunit 1 n=1 Tax=Candidatus Bealeia paramacronuclearis TaxID=1921001 RepID=A0ABZ2C4U8_9PROT|nr:Cytochrome bd ubiquinol oxidase subunit 1 [Candidatus Bealeia paramacronuclearis]
MEALELARAQFAANITFHILFPSISIGLAWLLFYFKLAYVKTRDSIWLEAYTFWVKIFALTFAMGVVSGITMSFQFGTNWPGFMKTVGNVAGPLLGYEVLTAFFLESVFLGIMLFGIRRVPERVHTVATFLVAFGTMLSAFWILVLNSWMQTPVGFEMKDGVAHVTSWLEILSSPSLLPRFLHMTVASFLTASFLISGISAYRLLMRKWTPSVETTLKIGLVLAAVFSPIQLFLGDIHGLNTLKYQPQKIAAMEGNWNTQGNVPLLLFAIPDEKERKNTFEIGIPSGASLILKHHTDGIVPGLNEYKDNHPPVKPVFYAFRIMVGVGLLMILISWVAAYVLWKKRELPPFLIKAMVGMTFSGWIATVAGWYVSEVGRQPWLVHDILKTANAASSIPAETIGLSLSMYVVTYIALTISYILLLFYLARRADQRGLRVENEIDNNLGLFISRGAL